MARDGFQQLAADLVGIGIQKTHPAKFYILPQPFQQHSKTIFQAKVFAVTGSVLADERDLAHAPGSQPLGFSNHGFKMPGTELAAKLRNAAEAAGMVAAFG